MFRNDRTSTENVSKHGGVLIAVRRDINAEQLTLDHTFEDAITVLLTDKTKAQKLLISCIYIPPKKSPYRWPPEKYAQFLTSLKTNAISRTNWENFNQTIFDNPFEPYCYSNVDEVTNQWYLCFNKLFT